MILLSKIVAEVLDFSKLYQTGRATKKVAIATFDFTEGWFRNSGLYNIKLKVFFEEKVELVQLFRNAEMIDLARVNSNNLRDFNLCFKLFFKSFLTRFFYL